jgi:hypothetical protein
VDETASGRQLEEKMAATKETVVVTVDAADIVKDSSATSSSKSEGDPDSTNTPAVAVGDATPYLTGFKLFILMSGLTTLMLLVMLDIAILSTVRFYLAIQRAYIARYLPRDETS